ncbi:SMP-30/gluconolactonase/LRE family protein [Microlunatus speluncae]|uniref:SMP-30/gluconolactonase/LRE family protein n=1 Tax=Microlunatus speluncae TaxID=2594267 RepID=UPI0012662FD2|nr:SMP-30/gluconolactonase/LRE family protein [Microlunatus speluncae]
MQADQLTEPVVDHGEGPVYSVRWAGPRWVDMLAGDILELRPDGEVARQHVGTVAAVIRPRRGGGHVIAGERGLLLADDDALDAPVRAQPEVWAGTDVRMNEGGCDPAGNLYLGSMAYDGRPGGGTLYRFGPDLAPTVAVPEVTISNGLEWSPDDALAYYVDTRTGRIDVFDWDPDGGLRDRRPFVEVDGEGGPDGLTVDAEGGVWVALYGGWAVRRYTAAGRLDEVIEVPARQVTALTFAGPELDQLIITTSRHGLEDDVGPAGALFGARPGIRGRPVREFAG